MKKFIAISLGFAATCTALAGCASNTENTELNFKSSLDRLNNAIKEIDMVQENDLVLNSEYLLSSDTRTNRYRILPYNIDAFRESTKPGANNPDNNVNSYRNGITQGRTGHRFSTDSAYGQDSPAKMQSTLSSVQNNANNTGSGQINTLDTRENMNPGQTNNTNLQGNAQNNMTASNMVVPNTNNANPNIARNNRNIDSMQGLTNIDTYRYATPSRQTVDTLNNAGRNNGALNNNMPNRANSGMPNGANNRLTNNSVLNNVNTNSNASTANFNNNTQNANNNIPTNTINDSNMGSQALNANPNNPILTNRANNIADGANINPGLPPYNTSIMPEIPNNGLNQVETLPSMPVSATSQHFKKPGRAIRHNTYGVNSEITNNEYARTSRPINKQAQHTGEQVYPNTSNSGATFRINGTARSTNKELSTTDIARTNAELNTAIAQTKAKITQSQNLIDCIKTGEITPTKAQIDEVNGYVMVLDGLTAKLSEGKGEMKMAVKMLNKNSADAISMRGAKLLGIKATAESRMAILNSINETLDAIISRMKSISAIELPYYSFDIQYNAQNSHVNDTQNFGYPNDKIDLSNDYNSNKDMHHILNNAANPNLSNNTLTTNNALNTLDTNDTAKNARSSEISPPINNNRATNIPVTDTNPSPIIATPHANQSLHKLTSKDNLPLQATPRVTTNTARTRPQARVEGVNSDATRAAPARVEGTTPNNTAPQSVAERTNSAASKTVLPATPYSSIQHRSNIATLPEQSTILRNRTTASVEQTEREQMVRQNTQPVPSSPNVSTENPTTRSTRSNATDYINPRLTEEARQNKDIGGAKTQSKTSEQLAQKPDSNTTNSLLQTQEETKTSEDKLKVESI